MSVIPGVLKVGFRPEALGTTKNWYNLAVQHNKPNALKGYYPNVELDYSKLIISHGTLKQPINPKVEVVLVYFPKENDGLCITCGAERHQGFDILPIPKEDKNSNGNLSCFCF